MDCFLHKYDDQNRVIHPKPLKRYFYATIDEKEAYLICYKRRDRQRQRTE